MRDLTFGICLFALLAGAMAVADEGPGQASGLRIGEVTQESAIVWTRLTGEPIHIGSEDLRPTAELESDEKRADYGYEVPGAEGVVSLRYWREDETSEVTELTAVAVEAQSDYTHQFRLAGLQPGAKYVVESLARTDAKSTVSTRLRGEFRTAPAADEESPVVFTVVTGQGYHRRDDRQNGHQIYKHMSELDPSFFVHTGDILYYDKPRPVARDLQAARFHWHRMYALPFLQTFHNQTASYFIKDDHDTLKNDCWPGQSIGDLTWQQGLDTFREQVPMGEKTYRTIRWGRDLQVWLVEGRDFRSPNTASDDGTKTIWGEEQIAWFKKTVSESDATFRVLISPTPLVGPDRAQGKNDNHANQAFATEGKMLRKWISEQAGMFVICGDRHWQYVSEDPETGLDEYCTGPTSNAHAGG